ncbi:DUF6913 domain-containing protein [Spongiivirga citrea]|uniref:Uncharacterized protein n=1 Tax=Spongiivirga citrea TaxID=1481457 RepID=A0A6M0CV08_9FLAO|nr:hypothetical protein [Spongiivirga citrea]NER17620.1 hypothetical protein [Spongiivirga citrea]
MFLEALKKKTSQNFLKKALSRDDIKTNYESTGIHKVGCIVDAESFSDFEAFSRLANSIDLPNFNLNLICYHSDPKMHANFDKTMFSEADFGWNGRLKHFALQHFAENPMDLLINYFDNPDLLGPQLIAAQSQAAFRVGFEGIDKRLNDLVISTDIKNYDSFESELLKYLSILKII